PLVSGVSEGNESTRLIKDSMNFLLKILVNSSEVMRASKALYVREVIKNRFIRVSLFFLNSPPNQ
ncbi:hypothetical protein, partial [Bacillus thuringiensis]|uniref:hypothetical protein n=1 Tax=Bacillus thuringiensis TaxID=1428 RepID=UPI001FB36943